MIVTGAALTNTGSLRSSNQDCILAGSWKEQRSMIVPYTFEFSEFADEVVLVADGMGGHRAGEHASGVAVDAFLSKKRAPQDPDELLDFLRGINKAVFDLAVEDTQLQGMGTTAAGLICLSDALLWFNIGDSKVFRFRDDFLRQLSVDDVASASIAHGSRKPGLTQALGGAPKFVEVHPHIGVEPIAVGWRYLICSDGLTDVVPTASIEQIMAFSDEEAAQQLLDAALAQGAPDNVSVILITVKSEAVVES
jgi:serine/threonine protein phosphatase PrpC